MCSHPLEYWTGIGQESGQLIRAPCHGQEVQQMGRGQVCSFWILWWRRRTAPPIYLWYLLSVLVCLVSLDIISSPLEILIFPSSSIKHLVRENKCRHDGASYFWCFIRCCLPLLLRRRCVVRWIVTSTTKTCNNFTGWWIAVLTFRFSPGTFDILTDRLFSPRCPSRDSISLARKITAAESCDMNSPRENRLDGGDRGDHHGSFRPLSLSSSACRRSFTDHHPE
jgi:hypothetical protein